VSDAREVLLRRVAEATDGVRDADPDAAYRELPRGYRRSADATGAGLLDLLVERLVDYGVTVARTRSDALAGVIADELTRLRADRVVLPDGAPAAWRSALEGRALVADDADPFELDAVDATLSGCAVAVAETGTIVLDGAPDQGRRAATLVPDVHLCVVGASQVVRLVPEAIARLEAAARVGAAFTWIAGPSATSDIELVRVAGVHGPRRLIVLLVDDA
jgi:L-lactate dehydrogenase complex protein LldG